jgi:hypothetical protein
MSKYSRDLKVYTNKIVIDIFDNFDDYDTKDKQMVYELLTKMKKVNEALGGYDNTKKSWYKKWLDAVDKSM